MLQLLQCSLLQVLLIIGCTNALPDLTDAPRLTLDELVGAGSFAPPTAPPFKNFGIPPNPEANPKPVHGIRLPVFDPNKKFDGPPLINDNNKRIVPMPADAFKITFNKTHPVNYNASEPIHVDLTKFISDKFECGFCIKIVTRLKEEIKSKGVHNFTEELKKTCLEQREVGQWYTSCEQIDEVKAERLATETPEALCISEKRCKDHEDAQGADVRMDELERSNKEDEEMREKWNKEREKTRLIVEAEEEKWRREFTESHPETIGIKNFQINFPEVQGSGEDNWKPDFGGWDNEKERFNGDPVKKPEDIDEPEETTTTAEPESTTASAPSKFTLQNKPPVDFVHEVLAETVQKEDSSTPPTAGEAVAAEGETTILKASSPLESAVHSEGTPNDENGPEPTSLFSTTTESSQFTKGEKELEAEQEARRILQQTVLEAKKTVDDDVGFMSKPVDPPNRAEQQPGWTNGPRLNLHEFSPNPTQASGNVETSTTVSGNVEEQAKRLRAPIQCAPPKQQQFSAHPAAEASADEAPATAAAAATEERKVDLTAEEAPANMAIQRRSRVVNRVVQTAFQVDDIA